MKPQHAVLLFAVAVTLGGAGYVARKRVGEQADGGVVVPTGQLIRPAGKSLTLAGRPLDLVLSTNGKTLYAKDNRGVVVVDVATWQARQELEAGGGTSSKGLALSPDGKHLYVSNAASQLLEADIPADGSLKWTCSIAMPAPAAGGAAYPCGIACSTDGAKAYVCLSRNNSLAVVNLRVGTVTAEIPVGLSPFDVVLSKDGTKAFVSNWGGGRPKPGARTAPSSGTEVEVDMRGIGSSGTVSCVDLRAGREVEEVPVGLQPCDEKLSEDGNTLLVACSNSDAVSVIDTRSQRLTKTILVRLDDKLPFGGAPNGIALSAGGRTLLVANGGNNAVGVFDVASGKARGWIPTGWYPGAVLERSGTVYVANIKGWGSRGAPEKGGGRSVYEFAGTLQKVDMPDARTLRGYTAQVLSDALVHQVLAALERSRSAVKPVPVPAKLGEPSTIEHVFYIVKENRTYDQMLGDMTQGDGDPRLCMFPREVTPNHHALAEQFVLLDNYYCNGVNSADGHAWCMEGDASAFLERSFGGWTRSYPYGDDPLSPCSSGFVWDAALGAGLSFRNFGEFDYAEQERKGRSFKQVYDDFVAGKAERFKQNVGVERLKRYTSRDYPGWNLGIPDVLRADRFVEELKAADGKTPWPNLTIVYLPQDHNSGTAAGMPTPRAHTADNDLALGRVVEAISHSSYWPKTAIFVIEDDPQNGFDHVDGHRSLCLVISPYARRRAVVSEFYNQSSVMHTMEHILGFGPMNQMDGSGSLMTACFTARPDLTPYKGLPNQIRLDEMNPSPSALRGRARALAVLSARQDFRRQDRADDDLMNRALWASVKGDTPYPQP